MKKAITRSGRVQTFTDEHWANICEIQKNQSRVDWTLVTEAENKTDAKAATKDGSNQGTAEEQPPVQVKNSKGGKA